MTYTNYHRLDYYGGSQYAVPVITRYDRFHQINEFLKSIKGFCANASQEENTLLISKDGEIWINDPDKKRRDRLITNSYLSDIRCVNHIADIDDITQLLQRESWLNTTFSDDNEKLFKSYGVSDLKPEFYGIEFTYLSTNHFTMAFGIVSLTGNDVETFFNVRSLMT